MTVAEDEIVVRWAAEEGELQGALALREEVFCVEQGVSREEELDGRDGEAEHVLALAPAAGGPRVVGTIRLLLDGHTAKIGRVAVERSWRRRGIASRMLGLALERARQLGCTHARLAAQLQAAALYEQAGFTADSEVFQEAGLEHVWMAIALTPDS